MDVMFEYTNTVDDQMVEIMGRLKINVKYMSYSEWLAYILDGNNKIDFDGEGKTINEAVCNAAYEYFSEVKL